MAERATHVAQRAARAVADHHRRERGALAAIAGIEVLDHLLAPLVLEVDVDVRRLVALARDEPLHQQRQARRIDLGDAEAEAHGRVGSRATALAEDAALAGMAHHVVHGEEERLVTEFGDERELVLDLGAHALRGPARPAPAHALRRQQAQVTGRAVPVRDDLPWVLVAQLPEVEAHAAGDRERLLQQRWRVQLRERCATAQVAFAIGLEPVAGRSERGMQADRGERVLQRAPAAHMHVHATHRHRRQPRRRRERTQPGELRDVVAAGEQRDAKPGTVREAVAHPGCIRRAGRAGCGNPDGEAAVEAAGEVAALQAVAALRRRAPATGDELAQPTIAVTACGEQHQVQAIVQPELGADDEWQPAGTCGDMRAHDTRYRALVGDGERSVAELMRALHELGRMRGAAQEGEVAEAVQLGIRRPGHGVRLAAADTGARPDGARQPNRPCRYQPPARQSRKIQARRPRRLRAM